MDWSTLQFIITKSHKINTNKRRFIEHGSREALRIIYQHGFIGRYLLIPSMVRKNRHEVSSMTEAHLDSLLENSFIDTADYTTDLYIPSRV